MRLLVVTDLDGYLEPCGCTSRPLGGIDRMAARIASLRAEGVPTAVVMAGNLLFHGAPHGGDAERARDQEMFRAEALVGILDAIDVTAANVGPLDLAFGADTFADLADDAGFPLLAAGAAIEGRDGALAATRTQRVGDLTLGLVGLASLEGPDGQTPDGLRVSQDDLRAAGRDAVRSLRAEGADVIVALVTGDRRAARRVATGIEGIDFVIHGGLDQAEVNIPAVTDGAAVIHAGRQGQGVVVLDVFPGEGEAWRDASEWTREARRGHLEGRIATLARRVAEWERDEGVDEADLARQRGRLAALREELAGLEGAPRVRGRAFAARYEELAPDAARDDAITARMAALDQRTNEHNRTLFADWEPEPAPEGQPHYLGSEACRGCHTAAFNWWRGHAHGRAYATLETRNKNFNLSCVGCHVTGYLEPGGSTVTHVERLQDVGCESCHGPGSQHAADPTGAAVNVRGDTPETTCVRCHNEEHSDTFDYATYRQLLRAPGHGLPASE